MGDIVTLVNKIERAKRNNTGFNVRPDEIDALFTEDIMEAFYAAKLRRLKAQCHEKPAPTSSATSGSTRGGTANRRTPGKSPDMPRSLDQSYIAAHTSAI